MPHPTSGYIHANCDRCDRAGDIDSMPFGVCLPCEAEIEALDVLEEAA